MANLLKNVLHNTSAKSPQDLVSRTAGAAEKLTDTASERQQEELSKYLTYMKVHWHSDTILSIRGTKAPRACAFKASGYTNALLCVCGQADYLLCVACGKLCMKVSAIKIIFACVLLIKRGKTHRGGLLGHGSGYA